MERRRPVSAWALSLVALAALCFSPRRAFVAPPPPQLDLTAPTAVPRGSPSPSGHTPALTLAFTFALLAGQLRRPARTVRRAEGGILDMLEGEDKEEQAAKAVEKELEEEFEKLEFTEDEARDAATEELSEEELARRGERQIVYKLYPSLSYISYIARKNAQRYWAKDTPRGKNADCGCLEVQIAIVTEKIRSKVLHLQDNTHDFKCRNDLVVLVSRRRKLLDVLSWKDLDSYLKIREELKIRHVYRLEALIGRLPYKYQYRDRPPAPGRKTVNKLKKTKKILARRLATQLRQGQPRQIIHRTKKKMKGRQWLSRGYDEVEWMLKGKPWKEFVDPLNSP